MSEEAKVNTQVLVDGIKKGLEDSGFAGKYPMMDMTALACHMVEGAMLFIQTNSRMGQAAMATLLERAVGEMVKREQEPECETCGDCAEGETIQ